MGKLVLVTRPIEQAKDFAEIISAMGFSSLIQPLLDIEHYPFAFDTIQKPDAILLSSAQAVHGVTVPQDWMNIPVFCVGEMTEKSAHQAGFEKTIVGPDNVNGIVPIIREVMGGKTRLLYLRGEHVAQDIKTLLPHMSIDEVITYNAKAAPDMRSDVIDKFADIDIITVFSSRTGAILRQLIEKNGLLPATQTIKLLCLSSSVVESLGDLKWKSCHVADMPNQASLIEKLKSI